MLKRANAFLLLFFIWTSCYQEQELKAAKFENFSINNELIGDGDEITLMEGALKLDRSMDLKAYYFHRVYHPESHSVVNLISPIAVYDTTKKYQFISQNSYSYTLFMERLMKQHNMADSTIPLIQLVVFDPNYNKDSILKDEAVIGCLAELGTEVF